AGLPQPLAVTQSTTAAQSERQKDVRAERIMGWVPQSRARGRSAHSEGPMPSAATAAGLAGIAAAPAAGPRCRSVPGDRNPRPCALLRAPAAESDRDSADR